MSETDAQTIRDEESRAARLFAVLQKALRHELPNTLIGVQGMARLLALEEGERLSDEGRNYLERITAGAAKAHALVTALAEVARLGRAPDTTGTVDLGEVVAEAVAEANQLARGRFVEYYGPKQLLILAVSRPALRRVLGILLRRAGPGEPARHMEVSAHVAGSAVEIRVADDGPALAPEQITRLFEPFRGEDDQGLNWFLLRQLVEDWGGSVRVESGRVFVVSCPLSTQIV
jgi:signal transduction histidine kinase